ncbi:MAG: extracellular solute-binding protein [Elusimicrobiota bacterium]|jgi:putative spermidine/putrescine transport system substrate-binding protein|nr:extracellular solute-binding protein [Elusimicrobiota bacterium]
MKKTLMSLVSACLAVVFLFGVAVQAADLPAPKVKKPLVINITDVGGAFAFTKEAFETYAKKYPEVVARFVYNQAPAPELPGKLLAMQRAKRSDIDLVVGGLDILSSGIDQKLWEKIDFDTYLPGFKNNLIEPAKATQALANDFGVQVGFMINGPYPFYNPDKVKNPPTTPAELLAWAKANPGKFIYARPANSGPARSFIMGLPYLLGDKDPKDPVKGWDKTWAYLEELGKYIDYYPTGTGATMKEFGEGTRWMTITTTGWDINPRALGIVPERFKVVFFKNMTFVNDEQYMLMPKGLSDERKAVVLHIMNYMTQPAQQAYTWDKGYFYPGPVIKGVPLSMAPKESQEVNNKFGRKEYETITTTYKQAVPLNPQDLVTAFKIWDERVGSKKK